MKVQIGHAVHDERNKAKGGEPGDQTGGEVLISNWYNKPWTNVFRPKSHDVAEKIAVACTQGCKNNYIGYDQSQRTTLFTQAEKVGFDLSKIMTPCETDCSAFVAVCVNAAGINVSKHMYTGSELNLLRKTGKFDIFTTDDYCRSSEKLRRGDILLGKGHTAMVLTDGARAAEEPVAPPQDEAKPENPLTGGGVGIATAKGSMNIRSEARSTSRSLGFVHKGDQLEVLEVLSNGWYKVVWDKAPNGYAYTSNVGGQYYLYDGDAPATKPETPPSANKYVLTGSYNIRKTPGSEGKPSGDILGVARKGAIFTADGENAVINGTEWLKGTCGSVYGYISSKGLKKI